MKKYLITFIMFLFAAGAYAQEAPKSNINFNYSVFASYFAVAGSHGDQTWDYQHVRLRPFFTLGNENVKIVTRFEIDQDYGAVPVTAQTYGTTSIGADPGNDNFVVEVKWAYLEVKDLLINGLKLTTGLAEYSLPWVFGSDFGLTTLDYDMGEIGTAKVGYIKMNETSYYNKNTATGVNQNEDSQMYLADFTFNAGSNLKVRPAVLFLTTNPQYTSTTFGLSDATMADYTLSVTGKFDMFSFNAVGAYMTLKANQGAAKVDGAGYLYDISADVKPLDGLKIGAFVRATSGQDMSNDKVGHNAIMQDLTSSAVDGRLFILEVSQACAFGGYWYDWDISDMSTGYSVYGGTVDYALGKFKAFAQYGYLVSTEKNASGDSKIGQEIDARVSYLVGPATTIYAEYGFFKAGDKSFTNMKGATPYPLGSENIQQICVGAMANI